LLVSRLLVEEALTGPLSNSDRISRSAANKQTHLRDRADFWQ